MANSQPSTFRAVNASTSKASPNAPPIKPRPKPNTISANLPLSARRSQPLDLASVERKVPASREPPPRTHLNGITEAPTFVPTEEEWEDVTAYLEKIAPTGRKYGIVKIIPPASWDPPFAVDTEVSPLL